MLRRLCTIGERASASAPTMRPVARLDQRLEEDLDLLVRDRGFEHAVADGSGGRRCPRSDARLPHSNIVSHFNMYELA